MKFKIYAALLCILPFIGRAQLSWHVLPTAPHTYRHDDIYFLNPQKGWAINANYEHETPTQYGQVWTTNDGGSTWAKIFDSSLTYIRCVGFADSLHGWFGNLAEPWETPDTNFLYQTADGGHHWTPVTNVTGTKPVGICGISVVTDSVIYAYGKVDGPARFMKTINQGFSWTSIDMSAYASFLIDAKFFSKDTGIVVGAVGTPSRAVVLYTTDGGVTWSTQFSSLTTYETCWKVFFPSRNIGYASIESGLDPFGTPPDTTYFLKTTDGGINWTKHIFSTTFYDEQGCGFINDRVGWIGGDQSTPETYKTTDGGATWFVDTSFGVEVPIYNNATVGYGYAINRFRRFGDTLMYASGCTIYKYSAGSLAVKPLHSAESHFNVYPDPATNKVFISGAVTGSKLSVFDLSGKEVYRGEITDAVETINISGFVPGSYVFRVSNGVEVATRVVIKE